MIEELIEAIGGTVLEPVDGTEWGFARIDDVRVLYNWTEVMLAWNSGFDRWSVSGVDMGAPPMTVEGWRELLARFRAMPRGPTT